MSLGNRPAAFGPTAADRVHVDDPSARGTRRAALRQPWTVLLCSLLLALMAGCAARTPIEAPQLVTEPLPAPEERPYRLQAGDLLALKFWGYEELDEEQRIRPDGIIALPFIDEVRAAGLTPQELDAKLTELYSSELARPNLTVIVREAVPPRVYVSGEVGQQGSIDLRDDLTLFRAIQEAGGFTTTARRRQVLVIRQQADGNPAARAVDLRPVFTGADPTRDLRLAANDVVFVPRTKIRNVNLFITQYINDVIPLQNVFSGVLLADLTQNTPTETTVVVPPAEGGEP